MLLHLEMVKVIFYTAYYEDYKPIFFTTIVGDFRYVVADIDWTGVDDANHVHDEVLVKIRY